MAKGMGQRFDDWFAQAMGEAASPFARAAGVKAARTAESVKNAKKAYTKAKAASATAAKLKEAKDAIRAARSSARITASEGGIAGTLRSIGKGGKALRMGALGALPFAIPTLLETGEGLAMDVADPLAKALTGTGVGERSLDETLRIQDESEQAMLMENLRQQQVEEMARVNEQRIMQVAPHLANQLLAGRRLPQGAAVFGTQQRTDIFREFARQMATDPRLAQQPQQEPFP